MTLSSLSRSRTLIIGEMGSTPEGNLNTMKRLVDCAAECGADVVKNQWVSNAQTMCDRRHAPEYLESYELLQYPLEWHAELRDRAHALGMKYACSAYIHSDPTRLAPFVDYLKISSFESNDRSLIIESMQAGCGQKQVFVSLGLGARKIKSWSCATYLHCVSAYPAPISELNLRRRGGVAGFSDHSHDIRVGAWAVCAGASILETHFRLDDCDPANKDYAVAFTPAEFSAYIQNVREAEAALGTGREQVASCEGPMLRFRAQA